MLKKSTKSSFTKVYKKIFFQKLELHCRLFQNLFVDIQDLNSKKFWAWNVISRNACNV